MILFAVCSFVVLFVVCCGGVGGCRLWLFALWFGLLVGFGVIECWYCGVLVF